MVTQPRVSNKDNLYNSQIAIKSNSISLNKIFSYVRVWCEYDNDDRKSLICLCLEPLNEHYF